MKKLLLFGALTLMASSNIAAFEPETLYDFQAYAMSPDGRYIVSDIYGIVTLIDMETGDTQIFESDYETINYGLGMGNCVTSDGKVVGYAGEGVAILSGEKWSALPKSSEFKSYSVNGITPDGKTICGGVGITGMTIEDTETPMKVPAIWELQADGTYSAPKLLPCPKYDFTGRVPQYITAIEISEDGNTILGQIVDWSGFMPSMIVYRRDASDNWSYALPGSELLNPDHLEFPEYPGDAPEEPTLAQFLTPEKRAEYEKACEEWWAVMNWEVPYPDAEDYATAEEIEEYDIAHAKFETEYMEWYVKFDAFNEVFQACRINGHGMVFNDVSLSPNGHLGLSTTLTEVPDPNDPYGFNYFNYASPVMFNLSDDTYKIYNHEANVSATQITDNGTILGGGINSEYGYVSAMIYLPGEDEPVTLLDYMKTSSPATYDWMKENVIYDVEYLDDDTQEIIILPQLNLSGYPHCTNDLSLFISSSENVWDGTSVVDTFVMPNANVGVSAATAESFRICTLTGGKLKIEGSVDHIAIFNTEGRLLYSGRPEGSIVETGLPKGAYIVKAQADGEILTLKAIF